MTDLEQQIESVNKKLDMIIGHFNIDAKSRLTPKECEDIARQAVTKFRKRNRLKSFPENG
jgi:hypothetical protein